MQKQIKTGDKAKKVMKVRPDAFAQRYTPRAVKGPFGLGKMQKLSQKLLPPSNDTDINMTITTHENVAEEDKEEIIESEVKRPDNRRILCEMQFQDEPKDTKADKYFVMRRGVKRVRLI